MKRLTDQGFPTVPPLEPSLSSVFRVRVARYVRQRIIPPSPSDQLTMRLTDKFHQGLFQAAMAMNNMAMLALSISSKSKELNPFLAKLDKLCTAADTITNLCAALAVCSAHISTWVTVLQMQMWLKFSSSTPEELKKELLEGSVSPDGLFSPHFQSVLDQLLSSSDALEQVRRHATRLRPDPCLPQTPGCWQEHRHQHKLQRCSTATATSSESPSATASRGQLSQPPQPGPIGAAEVKGRT